MTDDLANDLRIIATETGRLDSADRAKIIEAAHYFEETQAALAQAQRELIEANARRLAMSERLFELKPPSWSMSSGWIKCRVG
jgi:hypothetical protein